MHMISPRHNLSFVSISFFYCAIFHDIPCASIVTYF